MLSVRVLLTRGKERWPNQERMLKMNKNEWQIGTANVVGPSRSHFTSAHLKLHPLKPMTWWRSGRTRQPSLSRNIPPLTASAVKLTNIVVIWDSTLFGFERVIPELLLLVY